jgi:hypothetical protein
VTPICMHGMAFAVRCYRWDGFPDGRRGMGLCLLPEAAKEWAVTVELRVWMGRSHDMTYELWIPLMVAEVKL